MAPKASPSKGRPPRAQSPRTTQQKTQQEAQRKAQRTTQQTAQRTAQQEAQQTAQQKSRAEDLTTQRGTDHAAPRGESTGVSAKAPAGTLRSRAQRSAGREWKSIDVLRRLLTTAPLGATTTQPSLGIGDDAAELRASRGARLVWTIDGALEDVHFRRDWLSLMDLGWRATHAAVSDVAAMGARPVAALCHLVLPRDFTAAELRRLGRGQLEASRALACPVIGGNISSGTRLELVTTVLGEVPAGRSALERAGARPGDEVWLVGDVGLAAAGLRCLERGIARGPGVRRCLAAWRRPEARVEAGLRLQGRATACIDVSDGLVGDAVHLAEASDVALLLEPARFEALLEPLREPAHELGVDALQLALWGGEDYALLATGPARKRPEGARVIGRVEPGEGVWWDAPGRRRRLQGGFQHLTSSGPRSRKRP